METLIRLDDTHRLVIASAQGVYNLEAVAKLGLEARSQALDLGYKVLYDFRALQVFTRTLDAYYYPRTTLSNPEVRRVQAAFVAQASDADFWRFAMSTFRNAGMHVEVFYDLELAKSWLNAELRQAQEG